MIRGGNLFGTVVSLEAAGVIVRSSTAEAARHSPSIKAASLRRYQRLHLQLLSLAKRLSPTSAYTPPTVVESVHPLTTHIGASVCISKEKRRGQQAKAVQAVYVHVRGS